MAELIYYIIFLLNKIRLFWKANTVLNKRRRIKKTRLHQGKIIITRDTKDKLEQKNLGGLMGKKKGKNDNYKGG